MAATAASRVTYSGYRVTWCGPRRDRIQVSRAYQDRLASGLRAAPGPQDWLNLQPDDQGTVGDWVQADRGGDVYVIAFDSGVEITLNLPSTLVALGTPAAGR